ncbi:thioredoxin-like domain-containing protein [Pseudomassariella vexata]|uniref:Protein disulfide-isomerase n=1 Tax=Pseudomassariella vexata TaxID=1141098 RepID=A0A1Y2EER0_9PEZI|nr:thioredoxin-like domain-containing protein [Pseudomassariella vexata]ORY70062.1 thioredoxin-like domain-domain-containing protein [Pseudomassariella vexata]
MMCHLLLLASLATLAVSVRGWEHASAEYVESTLKEHDVVVVAFVAPSEEKCKSLEPEWVLATPESNVLFLSIDCTEPSHSTICKQHEAPSSWPRIELFEKGEAKATYLGPRRAAAILSWAGRVQRPTLSEVDNGSLNVFKSIDETVFIAYLNDYDESSRTAVSDIAAKFKDEFTFGLTTDVESWAAEQMEAPALKGYKAVDGDTKVFRGPFDVASLESFVKEASRPVIGELSIYNHQRYLDRGWPVVYIFASTERERTELRATLKTMARSYYDSLTMVTADPLEFPSLPAKFGLEPGVFPSGAVHQLSNGNIYPYPRGKPITPRALQSWGLEVWQGRVKPWSPPGATLAPTEMQGDGGAGRVRATRKVSVASFPGMKIKLGRDEL